jgi:predicted nucleic-acid-binding Zn-ribbon protein
MAEQYFECAKCESHEYQTGQLRTTGSGLSRFFNIQNQKYTTVSCKKCGYTELYKLDGSGVGNLVDFFTN